MGLFSISRHSYKYLGLHVMSGEKPAVWMKMTADTEETQPDWLLPVRELDRPQSNTIMNHD